MNKKFLSLVILGLIVSSPAFTANSDRYELEQAAPGVSTQLAADLTKNTIDWRLVHKTFSHSGDPDAATEATMTPKKSNRKKKGKGPKISAVSMEEYYAPLEGEITSTEQTIEALKKLLDEYGEIVGPLSKAQQAKSKRSPFSQDSENKLKAYKKAQKKVRDLMQNLKQNAGSADAIRRAKERREVEARMAAIANAQSREAAAKREEEKKQRLAIQNTPARATGMSDTEKFRIDKVFETLVRQQTRETSSLKPEPKFVFEQTLPFDEDITHIFHIVADYLAPKPTCSTATVHACPVCGEIQDTPCTIKLAANQTKSPEELERIRKHQEILSGWVKIAQDKKLGEPGFDITGTHKSGSPIYDLFANLGKEVQKHKNSKSGNLGLIAYRFHTLLTYKFEHVEQ